MSKPIEKLKPAPYVLTANGILNFNDKIPRWLLMIMFGDEWQEILLKAGVIAIKDEEGFY